MPDLPTLVARLEQRTEQLIAERLRAETLLLSIGDGTIVTDKKGNIQQINKPALEILDYKEKDLIGKWFPKVIEAQNEDGKKIELIDRPITKSLITGQPVSAKMSYKTSSGDYVAVSVTVSPIVVQGTPIGAIEIFRDISREQEIDRMKSDFIAIASHQLRTPLSSIKTYTHILADELEDSMTTASRHYVDIILSSILRMNEVISMLLNISRIEAGTLNVQLERTNIKQLVFDLYHELRSLANEKSIEFKLDIDGGRFIRKTDPLLFTEISANLISNAIKYTPAGGKVTVFLTKNNSGNIIMKVRDSGFGIPKHLQKNVFSKFFRTPEATIYDSNGSGLGLYMAQQMAEALGGEIKFSSREGKGSIFSFSL